MQFSERMAHIKPSATLTINAKALELKSQGVNVTSLAIGEPNFPTPAHVCDAAKQAIDEGFTRYTAVPGIPPLREAIAGYFKRAYGVEVAPDCTIASNGGKQSLYNLFAALLNNGDEVLVPSPFWVSYPDMVYLNGGVPVAVKAPASQGFKVTVEQLEAALTPKTRILVFNSPSNPTGACWENPLACGAPVRIDPSVGAFFWGRNRPFFPAAPGRMGGTLPVRGAPHTGLASPSIWGKLRPCGNPACAPAHCPER